MCPSSPCSYSPTLFFYGPIYFNVTQLVPTFLCHSMSFTSLYYFVVISLPLQFIQSCFPAGCCTVCVCLHCTCKLHVIQVQSCSNVLPVGHTVTLVSKSGNIVFAVKMFAVCLWSILLFQMLAF